MADDLDFDTPSEQDFEEDPQPKPVMQKARKAPVRRAPPAQTNDDEMGEELYDDEPEQRVPQRRAPPQMPRQQSMQQNTPPQQFMQQPMQQPQQPQPVMQPPVQPAQPAAPHIDPIVPYEMPKRIGFYNRVTQRPIVEDEDMLRAIMAAVADILNRLERIEASLS